MTAAEVQTVGIIGAGRIGQAMARIAVRAGWPVLIANSRGPDSLASVVEGLEWRGRIVIDPTNDFDPSDLEGRTSSEAIAELVTPARVVKAGNTMAADVLAADPHEAGGRRVIFLAGDDEQSKQQVSLLFEHAGFFVIDLGGLRAGGEMQQFQHPLAGHNLIRLP